MKLHSQNNQVYTGSVADYFDSISDGKSLALLVSQTVEIKNSSLAIAIKKLENRTALVRLPSVSQDAPIPEVQAALEVLRSRESRSLIAIGGGSTLDAAKILSVFALEGDIADTFHSRKALPPKKIALTAMPTTAGSGAELSYGAILFDPGTGRKAGIRGKILQPEQVLIDPDLYLTAPDNLIAEVGFDALTHAIETYVSKASTPICQIQSVQAIRTVLQHLPRLLQRKSSKYMEQIALSAAMMGNNLANSSTCLPHRIQYALRAHFNISHAQGLLALYNGWLDLIEKHPKHSSFDQLAADLGYNRAGLINTFKELPVQLGVQKRLRAFNVTSKDVSAVSNEVEGQLDQDPFYSGVESIEYILEKSL